MIPLLQITGFSTAYAGQLTLYGVYIAVIVIPTAVVILWWKSRSSKSTGNLFTGGSKKGAPINFAFILTPDKKQIVDIKPFFIHRDEDISKNVVGTYALFPEEERGKSGGIQNVIQGFKKFLGMHSNPEDEQKKGRTFDEDLALSTKIQGIGWVTSYTLKTNTQAPIFQEEIKGQKLSPEMVKAIEKFKGKEIEVNPDYAQVPIWSPGMFAFLPIMERNVERRMAILKAVQSAAQQFAFATGYEQLAGAIKLETFALVIAAAILIIVLALIPGSINTIVHNAVTQLGGTLSATKVP